MAASTSTPNAVGTQVTEEALPRLLNLLSPVACSWDLFVQQIGVPPAQVSHIRAVNPPTGPNYLFRCLTQALEWWVANHENPVYEGMINVLGPGPGCATPVMNRTLANQLRAFIAVQQRDVMVPTAGSDAHHTSPGPHVEEAFTQTNQVMMQGKFADLLEFMETRLQQRLAAGNIEHKLRLFVIRLHNVPESSIPVSSDVSVIIEAMRRQKLLTYLNITGLEVIMKHFCDGDSEVNSKMEQYKRDQSGFELATKIKDYAAKARSTFPHRCDESASDLQPRRTPAYLTELTVKLEHRVAEYHLDYLRELWELLSNALSLPPLYLILDAVIMGSVIVVWLIPTDVVSEATKRAKQNAGFFKSHPILKVTIGDDCVYSKSEPTGSRKRKGSTDPHGSRKRKQTTDPQAVKVKRKRCGECEGCKREDCRECVPCKGKKKYGGPGKYHRVCIKRTCEALKQAPETAKKLVRDQKSRCLEPGESSDDELALTPVMAVSLADPAPEAIIRPGVDSITDLLQHITQKVTELQTELTVKENELALLRQKEKEQLQKMQQLEADSKHQVQEIARIRSTAVQKALKAQEQLSIAKVQQEQEITQLRQTAKDQLQKIQQLEADSKHQVQEIARIRSTAMQKALKAQEQLNIAKVQQEQEITQLRQTAKDQLQKIQQLETDSKRQVQAKELELRAQVDQCAQLKKTVEQQLGALREKDQRISQLAANGSELAQLRRLSEKQTRQIQDQQKRLQDRDKEVAELRESEREQKRKMKDWLASIPIHGVQITNLPP